MADRCLMIVVVFLGRVFLVVSQLTNTARSLPCAHQKSPQRASHLHVPTVIKKAISPVFVRIIERKEPGKRKQTYRQFSEESQKETATRLTESNVMKSSQLLFDFIKWNMRNHNPWCCIQVAVSTISQQDLVLMGRPLVLFISQQMINHCQYSKYDKET